MDAIYVFSFFQSVITVASMIFYLDDSKPTIQALQRARIITAVSLKWYELGVELMDNTRVGQLDIIKANNNDVSRCCLEALRAPGIDMNEVAANVKKIFIG